MRPKRSVISKRNGAASKVWKSRVFTSRLDLCYRHVQRSMQLLNFKPSKYEMADPAKLSVPAESTVSTESEESFDINELPTLLQELIIGKFNYADRVSFNKTSKLGDGVYGRLSSYKADHSVEQVLIENKTQWIWYWNKFKKIEIPRDRPVRVKAESVSIADLLTDETVNQIINFGLTATRIEIIQPCACSKDKFSVLLEATGCETLYVKIGQEGEFPYDTSFVQRVTIGKGSFLKTEVIFNIKAKDCVYLFETDSTENDIIEYAQDWAAGRYTNNGTAYYFYCPALFFPLTRALEPLKNQFVPVTPPHEKIKQMWTVSRNNWLYPTLTIEIQERGCIVIRHP